MSDPSKTVFARHFLNVKTSPVNDVEVSRSMSVSAVYYVTGMTCGHCVSAVQTELSALTGVEEVLVSLQTGGVSDVRVSSAEPLTDEQMADALDEAGGYRLAGPGERA